MRSYDNFNNVQEAKLSVDLHQAFTLLHQYNIFYSGHII